MRSFSKTLRAISLVTIFCFVSTQISWGAPAQGISVSTLQPQSLAGRAEVSALNAASLAIPTELGQVTDTVMGDPLAPAFIHIQSAHGNYQAEKNIEKLLGYMEKNSSVKLLLLEGAGNKLQPELFRLFPKHPDFNKKVTDKLMQEGYLTGPESFLIESTDKTEGWGIEDLDAYKKDRDAFISVVKKEKTAEKFLGSLRAALDRRFSSKLNKDLLNLVRQEEAFGSGTVPFESWIKTLGEGSRKHLKTDLSDAFYQDQYPFLIRYFRLQAIGSKIDQDKAMTEFASFIKELEKCHISKDIISLFQDEAGRMEDGVKAGLAPSAIHHPSSVGEYSPLRRAFDAAFNKLSKDFSMAPWPNWTLYAQYIILMQEMDGKGLQEETVRLKGQLLTVLARTADEKEYLLKSRELYLLRRLFSLELTRAEYEELKSGMEDGGWRKAINENLAPSALRLPLSGEINELIRSAIDFYKTALARENAMFKNSIAKMRELKEQRAVIVTGGFHADGLKKLAVSKHCSYLQITPRIHEVSKRDHDIYLKAMMGSRDFATSQAVPLLGMNPISDRIAVTGQDQTRTWRSEIRGLISGMINSEEASVRASLSKSVAPSAFGSTVPALNSVGARAETRTNFKTTSEKITLKVAEIAKDGLMFLIVMAGLIAFFSIFIFDREPFLLLGGVGGGLLVLSLASWGRYAIKKYIETTGMEIWDREYRRRRELEERARMLAVARQRSQNPVLDLIMKKAPEIPLSSALALVYEAKAALDSVGDFDVIHRPSEIIGHHPEEQPTGQYYEGDSYQSSHGYYTPRVEETKTVEVDDYSTESWDIKRIAKPRSESRLTSEKEKLFQKALSDLQPKWWDGRFNNYGRDRKSLAKKSLRELKEHFASALDAALKDQRWDFRYFVAIALGELKDPRAIPVLSEVLHGGLGNRSLAVHLLSQMTDEASLEALLEAIKTTRNDALAIDLVKAMGVRGAVAVPMLIEALGIRRFGSNFNKAVAAQLGVIGDLRAVPALMDELYKYAGRAAAEALRKMGDPRSEVALKDFAEYEKRIAREEMERAEREEADRLEREVGRSSGPAYRGGDRDHAYDEADWNERYPSFIPLPFLASLAGEGDAAGMVSSLGHVWTEHSLLLIAGFFVSSCVMGGIVGWMKIRANERARQALERKGKAARERQIELERTVVEKQRQPEAEMRRLNPVLDLIMTKAPNIPFDEAVKLVGQAKALADSIGSFDVVFHPEQVSRRMVPEQIAVTEDHSYAINGNSNDVVEDIRIVGYEDGPNLVPKSIPIPAFWTVEEPKDAGSSRAIQPAVGSAAAMELNRHGVEPWEEDVWRAIQEEQQKTSTVTAGVTKAAETLFDHVAVSSANLPKNPVVVVLGNPLPGYPAYVAKVLKELNPSKVLIVGNGVKPEDRRTKANPKGQLPEWRRIWRALLEINPSLIKGKVLVDRKDESMNTGENVVPVISILNREKLSPSGLVLIQAPQGLRVSQGIFQKQWIEKDVKPSSHPVFYTYVLPEYVANVKTFLRMGNPELAREILNFDQGQPVGLGQQPNPSYGLAKDLLGQMGRLKDWNGKFLIAPPESAAPEMQQARGTLGWGLMLPDKKHTFTELPLSVEEPFSKQEVQVRLDVTDKAFLRNGQSRVDLNRVMNQYSVDGVPRPFGAQEPDVTTLRQEFVDRFKQKNPERDFAVLTNGNLGWNNFYVGVANGKVYYHARDTLTPRAMLVTFYKQKPQAMRVSFRKTASGEVRILGPEGKDITEKIETAVYGLPLVKEGKESIAELFSQLDDLRHLFRFPMFQFLNGHQWHLGMSDGVGSFYKDQALRQDLLAGKPVTLSVKPLLEKGVSFEEIEQVYDAWGYEGEYVLDRKEQTITVAYKAGIHPHTYFGLDENGNWFAGSVSQSPEGTKPLTHFSGTSLKHLAGELIGTHHAIYAWLWANGKDVSLRPDDSKFQADGLRNRFIETLIFSRPLPPVASPAARSEMRTSLAPDIPSGDLNDAVSAAKVQVDQYLQRSEMRQQGVSEKDSREGVFLWVKEPRGSEVAPDGAFKPIAPAGGLRSETRSHKRSAWENVGEPAFAIFFALSVMMFVPITLVNLFSRGLSLGQSFKQNPLITSYAVLFGFFVVGLLIRIVHQFVPAPWDRETWRRAKSSPASAAPVDSPSDSSVSDGPSYGDDNGIQEPDPGKMNDFRLYVPLPLASAMGKTGLFERTAPFFIPGTSIVSGVFLAIALLIAIQQTREIMALRDSTGDYRWYEKTLRERLQKAHGIENPTTEQMLRYTAKNSPKAVAFLGAIAFVDFSGLWSGAVGVGIGVMSFLLPYLMISNSMTWMNYRLIGNRHSSDDRSTDDSDVRPSSRSESRLTPVDRAVVNARGQRIANYLAASEEYFPTEDRWAPVTLEGLKLSKDQKVLMMVLGTWDARPAYEAARIYRELQVLGVEPTVLTSGKYGNKPGVYFDAQGNRLPEAVHYRNILEKQGVPVRFVEDRSTNTGENIRFSKELLDQANFVPDVIIVVQNPLLQRRAGVSLLQQLYGSREAFVSKNIRLVSYSPYFVNVSAMDEEEALKLFDIGVREIDSLQTYPAKGWTTPAEIPQGILDDAAAVKKILAEIRSESREEAGAGALNLKMDPLKTTVIAMDGASATGKGTVARLLAKTLGYKHIELGVLNRAVAEKVLNEKLDLDDASGIEKMLARTRIDVKYVEGKTVVLRDGVPLTESIRSPEVGKAVALVSRHPSVLRWVFQTGRELGETENMVIEGRNVGTDVFPDTPYKYFLTADPDVRAKRRLRDFVGSGKQITLEQVKQDLLERDRIDSTRIVAPFRKAADAVEFDNTNRPAEETADMILQSIREKEAQQIVALMAKRDALPREADLLVVFGSPESEAVTREAAKVFFDRKISKIIVSGRFGKHIKPRPEDPDRGINEQTGESVRAEALVMKDALVRAGVPAEAIWVEKKSQGMTDNGVFSVDILKKEMTAGYPCRSVIFMHAPLLQLRGSLSLREALSQAGIETTVYDYAAPLTVDPARGLQEILWQSGRLDKDIEPILGHEALEKVPALRQGLVQNLIMDLQPQTGGVLLPGKASDRRIAAARILGGIKESQAIPALKAVSGDHDILVREAVLKALNILEPQAKPRSELRWDLRLIRFALEFLDGKFQEGLFDRRFHEGGVFLLKGISIAALAFVAMSIVAGFHYLVATIINSELSALLMLLTWKTAGYAAVMACLSLGYMVSGATKLIAEGLYRIWGWPKLKTIDYSTYGYVVSSDDDSDTYDVGPSKGEHLPYSRAFIPFPLLLASADQNGSAQGMNLLQNVGQHPVILAVSVIFALFGFYYTAYLLKLSSELGRKRKNGIDGVLTRSPKHMNILQGRHVRRLREKRGITNPAVPDLYKSHSQEASNFMTVFLTGVSTAVYYIANDSLPAAGPSLVGYLALMLVNFRILTRFLINRLLDPRDVRPFEGVFYPYQWSDKENKAPVRSELRLTPEQEKRSLFLHFNEVETNILARGFWSVSAEDRWNYIAMLSRGGATLFQASRFFSVAFKERLKTDFKVQSANGEAVSLNEMQELSFSQAARIVLVYLLDEVKQMPEVRSLSLWAGAPRVLFIAPFEKKDLKVGSYLAPPLGIYRIANLLRLFGVQADIFDPNLQPMEELIRMARENKYDVIGSSVYEPTIDNDIELAKQLKEISPYSIFVAGGEAGQYNVDKLLGQGNPFQLIARGMGEFPLLDVLQAFHEKGRDWVDDPVALQGIRGIIWRKSDGQIGESEPLTQMGHDDHRVVSLFFDTSIVPYEAYWNTMERFFAEDRLQSNLRAIRTVRMITSSHCGMGCTFCSSTNFFNDAYAASGETETGKKHPVLMLTADEILQLLKSVRKFHPKTETIFFNDDDFLIDPKRTGRLVDILDREYTAGTMPGAKLNLIALGRVDKVNPELLKKMKTAGFSQLNYGIEHFSDHVLADMHKKITASKAIRGLDWTLDSGISALINLIPFYPTAKIDDVVKTLDITTDFVNKGAGVSYWPFVQAFRGAKITGMGYDLDPERDIYLPEDISTRKVALEAYDQKAAVIKEIQQRYGVDRKLPHVVDVMAFFLAFYRAANVPLKYPNKVEAIIDEKMKEAVSGNIEAPGMENASLRVPLAKAPILVKSRNRLELRASDVKGKDVSRSETRAYEAPVIPQVFVEDTSSLGAKIGTAIRVAANTVSPLLSSAPAYASEVAPELFAGTRHFQKVSTVPFAFAQKWPMFGKILSASATASTERMVIDQRQGVPDAASVLPLVTFALYNPKVAVVLALIAEASEVATFEKELAALSRKGALPQNFAVRAFANENEFVGAFAGFYNGAAPLGQSVALITDREDSVVTRKIGSRRHLLSVVGARNPLKQTASTLLAADKLLNDAIWSMGYHFVSVEKLGGFESLMAELANFVATQSRVAASA